MTSKEAYTALNMIDHVGPVRMRHLLKAFGHPVAVLQAPVARLVQVRGVGAETAEAIANWENRVDLTRELRGAKEFECEILCLDDPAYPELLREIYDPPIVLYVRGSLRQNDKNAIAVVGSRRTTRYGLETARRLSSLLARAGVTVVSGAARGIDTAAHQGALAGGGRTVAVLGSGINLVIPPENVRLYEQIARNGALVSQFPMNRRADKQTFPIRNRIVAGMTLGTLVVEAGLTSGALITAGMALDYGRPVCAVPGRIDSPASKGCHELIKRGAKLCDGVEDILGEFEYLDFGPLAPEETLAREKTLPADLSADERTVLACLESEACLVDSIVEQTLLSPAAISALLIRLELKGLVKPRPGNGYERST